MAICSLLARSGLVLKLIINDEITQGKYLETEDLNYHGNENF